MEHILDASNISLGRIASSAAVLLRGKNTPAFERYEKPTNKVKIINASKMTVTGRKMSDKIYLTHSGYPGGQKARTLTQVIAKKGVDEAIRQAIYGMLPDNKLRAIMMKNLVITE
ncbi:MAG: 50S ribosomal protein L13 [Candidatus Vogelbacteria bacterium RIFOXYD1_FULL_44_32]|uniref:50S ribosomal protein L13 n=1 Tax=Candidatus Vogelbacteria bacterium RIFOXYD1_FULL_44_32 TaxID=1802438 RepID=A0A1G2QDU5_9BACT|nr:MAG: 50S ribosomal protein L13 [Candidatus Vogelbacteria bacterium RIFOXYD1_FULL_44_32]